MELTGEVKGCGRRNIPGLDRCLTAALQQRVLFFYKGITPLLISVIPISSLRDARKSAIERPMGTIDCRFSNTLLK